MPSQQDARKSRMGSFTPQKLRQIASRLRTQADDFDRLAKSVEKSGARSVSADGATKSERAIQLLSEQCGLVELALRRMQSAV